MTEILRAPANQVDNLSPNPNEEKVGSLEEILKETRTRLDQLFSDDSSAEPNGESSELGGDQGSKGAGESIVLPIDSLFRVKRPDGVVLFVVCSKSDETNQTGLLISPVGVSNFVTDKPGAIEGLVIKLTSGEAIMRFEGESVSSARVGNRFDVLVPIGLDEAGYGRLGWINNILDRFERVEEKDRVARQLESRQETIDNTIPDPISSTEQSSGGGGVLDKPNVVQRLVKFIIGR